MFVHNQHNKIAEKNSVFKNTCANKIGATVYYQFQQSIPLPNFVNLKATSPTWMILLFTCAILYDINLLPKITVYYNYSILV